MCRRRHLALILTAALGAAPGISRADGGRPGPDHAGRNPGSPTAGRSHDAGRSPEQTAALTSERQRLRTQLGQINAEIDALKREARGLGDDYRLRSKMADAEALARRLTELDVRAGDANRKATEPANANDVWPAPPQANPSDDRSDLEAKADILSDQSRRLRDQADMLSRRVDELRGRQELRRRAGQLERDPFSPLEQVQRRIATSASSPIAGAGTPPAGAGTQIAGAGTPPAGRTSQGASDSAGVGSTTGAGPPPSTPGTGTAAPVVGGGAAVGVPPPGSVTNTLATSTRVAESGSGPGQTPISSTTVGDSSGSAATQFRGILDAATLAEIRRLQTPGSSSGNLSAMERALIVLRARSNELEASATTLRKRARTTR